MNWLELIPIIDKVLEHISKIPFKQWLTPFIVSVIITSLLMGLVRPTGIMQPWELGAFDRLLRLRPEEEPDSRLLIVTIDRKDIEYQDREGMSRQGSLADRALVNFTNYPSRAWSQSSMPVNKSLNIIQVSFIRSLLAREEAWDFTADGRSGNRAGGASRGDCPEVQTPLTALIPTSNSGTTVAPRPTFWFYVPYSPQEATSGEFVLLDRQWNVISQIPFRLTETSGLIGITIPTTEPELEINKEYRWSFKLFCEGEETSSSSPIFVPQVACLALAI